MKKLLLTTLSLTLCLATPIARAQPINIQYSEAFDEPGDGWNKVLQLKNGNTFFFHFTKRDGIDVTVYNKERKVISEKNLTSELWEPGKMKKSMIEGLYEIGGQPVIFLHQTIGRTPTLFRIKLNANTGEIDGEKQIAVLGKYGAGAAWAMAYGGVEAKDFYIEKDPYSDAYAVINYNSFADESDEKIELIHYNIENGNHKIVNRAFFDPGGFKHSRFIGMAVDGDKRVVVSVYGYNKKFLATDSRVIISRLSKGEKNFVTKSIDMTDDFRETTAVMEMNPGTGMIQMMTLTYMKSKSKFFSGVTSNYYLTLMHYIDPESLYIVSTKPVMSDKVVEYAKRFHGKKPYAGLPQQMVINKDNSTTILQEETYKEIVTQNGKVVSVKTFLGSVGISQLDTKGNETDGYAVNKVQMAMGDIDPLYISHKSKGHWFYRRGGPLVFDNNAFMSFDYLNTDKNSYIIFNDYLSNYHQDEDERKKKVVTTINNASTICYRLNNGKIERSFLFGAPKEDNECKHTYIESSHYQKDDNTYAALIIDRDGKKKEAKIAWVKFK
jgi:hypothetical protein